VGEISKETFIYLQKTMNGFIIEVLGLENQELKSNDKSAQLIELMLSIRMEAKNNKNYALSDQIRNQLNQMGITIKDGKEGTTYSIT
jgi:cysteinyl-tRNA synthetase